MSCKFTSYILDLYSHPLSFTHIVHIYLNWFLEFCFLNYNICSMCPLLIPFFLISASVTAITVFWDRLCLCFSFHFYMRELWVMLLFNILFCYIHSCVFCYAVRTSLLPHWINKVKLQHLNACTLTWRVCVCVWEDRLLITQGRRKSKFKCSTLYDS